MPYNSNLDCVNNAYATLLEYRNKGKEGKVIFVFEPPHAYLLISGRVLNRGITFGNNNYPDYSPKQIKHLLKSGNAEDITDSLDAAYKSRGDDKYSVNGRQFPLSGRLFK